MPSQVKKFDRLLVVGLGNPGAQYTSTRHNIGFDIVDAFTDDWSKAPAGNAMAAKTSIDATEVHVLKPQTFMNLSGEAVQAYAHYFKIAPEAIVVIHDEADIPFGAIKTKFDGGTAGHNGLKSIAQQLGTHAFWRIRFGVGKGSSPHVPLDQFVLAKWTEAEAQQLPQLIEQTLRHLHELIVAPPQE